MLVLLFFVGLIAGAVGLFVPYIRARQEANRREAARQQANQDRQRVIEFMHHMAVALGEGLSREDLNQRIVHASILCSGALSGAMFERTTADTMKGVAIEGLFPPHRPLPESVSDTLTIGPSPAMS